VAVTNFIPEIWSARLLDSLQKSLVYGAPDIINRDYEGEIANVGDTVHIVSVGRPTINDYVPNVTVITPEELTDADQILRIDRSKYFAFKIDDVDARQAKPGVMQKAMQEASYGLRDVADQYIAGLYTGVAPTNAISTTTITSANAYDKLVDLGVKLDESDVPAEGRWVVIPPWYHGMLQKDNRFIDASASGTTATLRNGTVGTAAGFTIRKSNNTPLVNTDNNVVIAGVKGAWSYAEQIDKTEAYRPENSFSDAIKGLHLYGAKLVIPQMIATLEASPN
jgi:N4-gp56 family major capsid protein